MPGNQTVDKKVLFRGCNYFTNCIKNFKRNQHFYQFNSLDNKVKNYKILYFSNIFR